MKFEKFNISPEIKQNLVQIGFHKATDIQFKTIPAILNGEDVLAIAQTGTGKTAAFAIPIINKIHAQKTNKRSYGLKCIVLAPTRELAKQIGTVFAKLSRHTFTSTFALYGGVEQDPQIKQLNAGIDVLIATPGRMFDLIHQEHIDVSRIHTLVLDEADHMLDEGFLEDIKSIKRKLKQYHQTLFFSATINPEIKKLAYSQVRASALRIQVAPENIVSGNVTHYIARVDMDEKRHLLVNFLSAHSEDKILIFSRTKVRVGRVHKHLEKNSLKSFYIHGGMEQTEREINLESFRAATSGILIASDVSARGIDLSGITYVINYDLPDNPENYIHRVGRTGRGFAKGTAISFCSPEEEIKLTAIEAFINSKIQTIELDQFDVEAVQPSDLDKMEVAEILSFEESFYESRRQKKRKKKQ